MNLKRLRRSEDSVSVARDTSPRTAALPVLVAVFTVMAAVLAMSAPVVAQVPEAGARLTAEKFVEAFNSGSADVMREFYVANATEDFLNRRSEEEDAELYLRIWGDVGSLESVRIEPRGKNRVVITATVKGGQATATFDMTLDKEAPHRIAGFGVSLEAGGQGDDHHDSLPDLELPQDASKKKMWNSLDQYLQRLADSGDFSGSVVAAKDGKHMFEGSYGLANREKKIPVAMDTRFDLGSITKVFTKVGIGQLAQDGKLSLDDTLLKLMPDYPNKEIAGKVTIQQLLTHTSGLGDIFTEKFEKMPKEKLITPRSFFPIFVDEELKFEPGEGKAYSNAGYIVLGAVIEAVSGKSYERYILDHVFKPAGMDRSGFPVRDGTNPILAVGYTNHTPEGSSDGMVPNIGMLPLKGCPAGSSSSPAEDLVKFDVALRSGKLLDPAWTEWFFTESRPRETEKKTEVSDFVRGAGIGIAGGGPGVNAMLETGNGWTIVVLANLDPPVAGQISRKIKEVRDRLEE
jgi:D-alanyl-D-alanine carboxypeptidase